MGDDILLFCSPQECADILNGKQTVLVRNFKVDVSVSKPKRVFIYCGYGPALRDSSKDSYDVKTNIITISKTPVLNGQVIAVFKLCFLDEIKQWDENKGEETYYTDYLGEARLFKKSCLDLEKMRDRVHGHKSYAWYIYDLKVYNSFNIKSFYEFHRPGYYKEVNERYNDYKDMGYSKDDAWATAEWDFHAKYQLQKAPTTFCYVEV